MIENLSLLRVTDSGLQWQAAGGVPRPVSDEAVREALQEELDRREHQIAFAAPGGDLRLAELALAPEERRHLDASLPFMLEESIAGDIEGLHFARSLPAKDRCAVAIISHQWMEHWGELLGEHALKMPWIPEPLLLPWNVGQWTLVFEDATVLLRTGEFSGSRIETELLPEYLESLREAEAPQRVVVYGEDETRERALLPEVLREDVEWRRGDLGSALMLVEERPDLDLRQGDYAPRLPYARVWQQWKTLAVLAVAALAVHLLSGWSDLNRLERENLALRSEIQAVYREVNPRGAVVDAERQLRRQVGALRGVGSGGSFTGLLTPLAAAVADTDGLRLASLTYSQNREELRINLLAPSFGAVERLQTALAEAGVTAVLENSSRSGEQVRARLRLGGAP